jgi:ferredoxin
MDSLSKQADLAPKGCHNGACGVCKIKVHSGEFEKLKMNRKHITEEEEMNNIVLACKTFPKSDMEIEFISKPKAKLYSLEN